MTNPRVVHRAEWGAVAPKAMTPRNLNTDVYAEVYHYADLVAHADLADEEAAVRAIQNYHMVHNGWSDIAYNWLIGMTGDVYEGRDPHFVPAHCLNFNKPSLGFCFLTNGPFTLEAGASAAWLGQVANFTLGKKLTVFAHREKVQTSCPGDAIFDWVKNVRAPGGALG